MARKQGAKPPEPSQAGAEPPQRGDVPTALTDPRIVGVLRGLEQGDSLRTACSGHLVHPATFCRWVTNDTPEGLSKHYTQARETGCDLLADGIDELAGTALTEALAQNPKLANAVVQAIKLRVDTLKWTLAKRNPGRYGEKVDLTSGGKPLEPQLMVVAGREVKF